MGRQKPILITGASSDIGCQLIRELGREAQPLHIVAHVHRGQARVEAVEIGPEHRLTVLSADLSDATAVERLVAEVDTAIGCPATIVHLPAGRFAYTRLRALDWAAVEREMRLQVASLLSILQTFLPRMARRACHDKVVVMLTSYTIARPPRLTTQYTLVKHALLGLVRALAADYADREVHINAISPSLVETAFLDQLDPRIVEMQAAASVAGRNARVEDIVPAIRFLMSDGANYMNGVNLNVSNGNVL